MKILISSFLLSALACASLTSSHAAETFVFAPADGAHYVENIHREIVYALGQMTHTEVQDSVTQIHFKKAGDQVLMSRTPTSLTQTTNGKPVHSATLAVALNRTTTDVFDKDGKLLQVEGNEQLVADAKKTVAPALRPAVDKQFNPDRLAASEKISWNLIDEGRLVGHQVKLNERWESVEPLKIGNKTGSLKAISRVVDVKNVNGEPQATVLTFASSEPSLLAELDKPAVVDLKDPAVQDFLTWNVGDLPMQKIISKFTVDPRTLQMVQRETISVDVTSVAAGIETRTDHEMVTSKLASNQVAAK